jgi:CRP-like cAMP-binding protein
MERSTMVTPDLLRRYAHFAQLDEAALAKLASVAHERVIPAGEKMFVDNDPAEHLFLILHGEVQLQYEMGNGEIRVADTLVDGDLLVWSSLVEPFRCTADGQAVKETNVVAFDADKVRAFCEEDHVLGHRLLTQVANLLASRLQTAQTQLADV